MPATQLSLYSIEDNRYFWSNMASQLIYQAPTRQITSQSTGMRFQERDGEILQAIYERDGVMAKRQLKTLFWPEKTDRAMEKRLTKLYRLGYLDWRTIRLAHQADPRTDLLARRQGRAVGRCQQRGNA